MATFPHTHKKKKKKRKRKRRRKKEKKRKKKEEKEGETKQLDKDIKDPVPPNLSTELAELEIARFKGRLAIDEEKGSQYSFSGTQLLSPN